MELISKQVLIDNINCLTKLKEIFYNSDVLRAIGGGRSEKMKGVLTSYKSIFVYLYEKEYEYGSSDQFLKDDEKTHYFLVQINMTGDKKNAVFSGLADNWKDILQTIEDLNYDDPHCGISSLDKEVESLTSSVEIISGKKVTLPIKRGISKKGHGMENKVDKYSAMVDNAEINPFKITTNTLAIPEQKMPDFTQNFRQELMQLFHNPAAMNTLGVQGIVGGYVFQMIESYYNNAGYVPKVCVDEIMEQIHRSVQGTPYASALGPLDEMKDALYPQLLSD